MLTYPIPEEMMTLLKEAHERVKAHPYRDGQVGPQKSYANALMALSDAFFEALYTMFLGKKVKGTFNRPGHEHPDRVRNFASDMGHEFNTIVYFFLVGEGTPDLMQILEKHIMQMHHFLDTRKWTKYFVWYMPHHDKIVPTGEWEYVPERNAFELSDDYLKAHADGFLHQYIKLLKFNNNPSDGVREECRYYYDRIKKLGVTLTVDVTTLVKFMDGKDESKPNAMRNP